MGGEANRYAEHWARPASGGNAMSSAAFIERFGGIYEHSPWVAERAAKILDGDASTEQLASVMADCVDNAAVEQQLELIRAHPDLAGRAQIAGELTADSTQEQASAGLDRCTPEEYEQFQSLNTRYKDKFGFPFVMAVRGSNRTQILDAFESRLQHDYETEFETALEEIHKIARLRLEAMGAGYECGPHPFHAWVRLEQPRLGSWVSFATDEFFAAKERLIEPSDPVFIDGKYDDHGKWMDGWESRRRRTPGHDFCIIRLGVPGIIRGVDIDTSFFTGNYPPQASIDVCSSDEDAPEDGWTELVPKTDLNGDAHHLIPVHNERAWSHLRLNIYPDGGIARLRIYGEVRGNHSTKKAASTLLLCGTVGGVVL